MVSIPLGLSVPPHTPHAISVSLPTWRDNVDYEEGEKRVLDSMVSGYPRFFIHLSICKLAGTCEHKYAIGNEKCMLFPTQNIAEECRDFMKKRSVRLGKKLIQARLVHLFICPEDTEPPSSTSYDQARNFADLHIVLFPGDVFSVAKEFWQHTGMGISSRLAEKCLSLLTAEDGKKSKATPATSNLPVPSSAGVSRYAAKGGYNRHYSVKGSGSVKHSTLSVPETPSPRQTAENLSDDHTVYLEERYGRNLPITAAASAKRALRRRVAGVLIKDNANDCADEPCAGLEDLKTGPSSRGVANVTEHDVYLYPCGMAAIWSAHKLAREVRPEAKSVCFGFPYTDTYKIVQKWGQGAHFLGNGLDADIDTLETLLEQGLKDDPSKPPVLALLTEFPSNPLLRSADLPRLRALADKYDFLIIIDETIGSFVNVEVLSYADIVVSSLTKVFSGASNVMGGALVLNPKGRHYSTLKSHLTQTFEDVYFDEDAIYMERNSRDFKRRIKVIDANTRAVCEYLFSKSIAGGYTGNNSTIKNVFYPRYVTSNHYDARRVKAGSGEEGEGGYGGLFSLTFISDTASKAFFDALPCYKGPSLGTNFTLACPFTILAHYGELDWAAEFGVERGLVRISVGMEDKEELLKWFGIALGAAEEAVEQK